MRSAPVPASGRDTSAWSAGSHAGGRTACSTVYSTPSRRGQTTRGSPVGSSASISHVSDVIFEPTSICTNRCERVTPTPTQKRSSGSSKTTTSCVAGVPTSWRQTRQGRHASSTVG